ncbi:MAG: Mur ligase family protein, partial [Alphaproteobacteria bacterium]|nr:Mur ligase family protein [Alphaproteobacteria bacterium]
MLRENNTLLNNKVRLASILSNLSTIHSQEQINSSFKKAILNSSHLSCDSREIIENSTFIAIKGETYNGHAFIPKLLATNCLIIADEKENEILAKKIKEKSHQLKPNCQKAKIIFVKDTKAFATKYASVFYDHPSRQLKVVGITGTNGKTTSAYFLKHLYQEIGLSTGLIGTIEISYGDKCLVNPNTTPEPVKLQRHLFEMKAAGVEVVIMEISSHALALNRVDGLHLDSVIFTNITQDLSLIHI